MNVCLTHCRDVTSEPVIKFSKNSVKTVFKAAEIWKDNKFLRLLTNRQNIPTYHMAITENATKSTRTRGNYKSQVSAKELDQHKCQEEKKDHGGIKN